MTFTEFFHVEKKNRKKTRNFWTNTPAQSTWVEFSKNGLDTADLDRGVRIRCSSARAHPAQIKQRIAGKWTAAVLPRSASHLVNFREIVHVYRSCFSVSSGQER